MMLLFCLLAMMVDDDGCLGKDPLPLYTSMELSLVLE